MQTVTNTKLVEQGKQLGKITSLAGLIMLIGSMVVAFVAKQIVITYGLLIFGFILSNIGIYLANRWTREPRADQALDKVLRGFDNQYWLINYHLLAPHVLLMPTGLAHFVVKAHTGEISNNGSRWHHRLTVGRVLRFLVDEGLGNPTREAQQEAKMLQQFVNKHVPEGNVPIYSFIVFIAPEEKIKLQVTNPAVPVLQLGGLKESIRKLGKGKPLPAETQRQLLAAISNVTER